VALLKVAPPTPASIPLGDSNIVKPGSPVIAFGNAWGLPGSVTWGVVGGKGRAGLGTADIEDLIQLDANINPGDSGGPVVDMRGEVVGILVATMADVEGKRHAERKTFPQGVSFAIPIAMVKEIIPRLKSGEEIQHGWLGIGIQELTPALQAEFGVKDGRGVLVATIVESGPADRAGLRTGDVVRAFDGNPVASPREIIGRVAKKAVGEKASITILRGGEEKTVDVIVERRGGIPVRSAPAASSRSLGLIVEEMIPALAERFNIPGEEGGLVVTAVAPGSPGERSGVRKGDCIYEVNRKRIMKLGEWESLIAGANSGDKFLLRTQRGFFVVKAE